MAVSGVTLAAFVFVHLAGNLQIFLGPDQFNGYARTCATSLNWSGPPA